jgi:hypothetical protein
MYARVRDDLLKPETGLPPEYTAILRTKLGLPPPVVPANAPPPPSPK